MSGCPRYLGIKERVARPVAGLHAGGGEDDRACLTGAFPGTPN